ncbi:P-loop NTPase [Chryseobacterium limigenitum]|uniref:Novel STAND NTPase 5 domain-containing protein n=1 Tax=Chryseobacterium limigenitum TaxID=1612149 RepID=A0A1K2IGQ2_9FLAO|nr:hypothetical protein [Chryseobacterium limigenitum]SFZ91559.1 hypothetical protein SAMN05216324_102410 [Chryseobacterium limigenitum]
MQKSFEDIEKLVKGISSSDAGSVAHFMENKLDLLKLCYGKSDEDTRKIVRNLIGYLPLKQFLVGTPSSKNVAYGVRAIRLHRKNGLPTENSQQAIDLYNFYFDGYKKLFNCFDEKILTKVLKEDEAFLNDVLSDKEGDYYVSAERLTIEGIKIIDKAFIEKVKTRKHFTETKFYGATQNNDCQWYGIINEYDIIRNGYDDLKKVITNSFIEEKDEKVTAVICGSAGSGKSTTLRRIAVDLHDEPIHIVWVEDVNIEAFIEKGFPAIKNIVEKNETQKFLIIIEDWYRIFKKENKKTGIDILKKAKSINNIRIVIGDRTIDESYKNHRNNGFELHLSSDENVEIIEKIVEKYPDWKLASERLLGENKDYKSSLFLLLFILARIDQKEFKNETLDLSEPQQVFQRVIESDLRFIKKKHVGLAKALYYWGCIYGEHKILISYETFLKIADHYNKKDNTQIFNKFRRWNVSNAILDRLKSYINKNHSRQDFNAHDLIRFHHDIFADLGFKNILIEEWQEFDIKLDFLKVIIEQGDDYSASNYFSTLLREEKNIFVDESEIIDCIKILINKGNVKPHYMYQLGELDLDDNTMIELGQLFWKNKIFSRFSTFFWKKYFRQIKNELLISGNLHKILNSSNLEDYSSDFISCIMGYFVNREKVNSFIEGILHEKETFISYEIIDICLQYANNDSRQYFLIKSLSENNWGLINKLFNHYLCDNSDEITKYYFIKKLLQKDHLENIEEHNLISLISSEYKATFCNKILEYDYKKIGSHLIEKSFQFASSQKKRVFSNWALSSDNWCGFTNEFICNCLSYTTNIKQYYFAKFLLGNNNWKNASNALVIKSLLVADSLSLNASFSKAFFNDEDTYKRIDYYLFKKCFSFATHSAKQNLSNQIFQNYRWKTIDKLIIYECLEYCKDDDIKKYYYNEILNDEELNLNHKIIYNCLVYFSHYQEISNELNKLITTIINRYHKIKNYKTISDENIYLKSHFNPANYGFLKQKISSFSNYINLLKVNFYQHPLWREETKKIIINWKITQKNIVFHTLLAYRNHPNKVHNICLEILEEGSKQVKQLTLEGSGYIKLLRIALGHPNLKDLSKKTAIEIYKGYNEKNIPDSFKKLIVQIVENGIYPEWKI